MNKISILLRIFFAPFIVLGAHIFFVFIVRVYEFWPSFDILMHFLGGVSIAYGAWILFGILKRRKLFLYVPKLLEVFFLVAITSLAAVLWEFFEFTGGYIFGISSLQINLPDTIADLALGILGGMAMGGYLVFLKKKNDSPSIA